ncbi:MAG: pyruvate kinase [Candidatus Saccharibacteria bacterium]|nr:pyruvate kinase [Candidatus Saccharibacteria bacterium]
MAHIDTLKRARILATIGPATSDPEMLEKIIRAGVNACRLNFSHGSFEERIEQVKNIRAIEKKLNRHIPIVQDLQGPKIRLGQLKDDMEYQIAEGDELGLTYGIEHDGGNNLPSQYDLSDKCLPGDNIFLFDGKIRTVVQRIEGKTVWVKAMNKGFVISRKAINLPDMRGGAAPVLTEKDLKDLEWGLDKDFDYTALSFVHHADDVRQLRDIIRKHGSDRKIIVKLETKAGADPANLEDIVRESDGMMIARGDLAVEAGAEIVPVIEREIIRLCQKYCKFCVVATQMLGSMVDNPEPTRAEVNDVATAFIEGVDAVMLSDETAMGKYPVEAVSIMARTLRYAQNNIGVYDLYDRNPVDAQSGALADATIVLADEIEADAIVVEASDGALVRSISIQRPMMPVLAVASTDRIANQLSLLFGVRAFTSPDGKSDTLLNNLMTTNFFGDTNARVVLANREGVKIVNLNR